MNMLVTGFWITGQMSPGMKICSFLWWGSLRTSASDNFQSHPHCQVQTDPPNVEVTLSALAQWQRESWLRHMRPMWRLRGLQGSAETRQWWSEVSCCCVTKNPSGSWNQCSKIRSGPSFVKNYQGDPDWDLAPLWISIHLSKIELSRLVQCSRNGLSLGGT